MNALGRWTWMHPGALDRSTPSLPNRLLTKWSWEPTLAVFAVVAAVIAFWLTLRAGFLAHPAVLAVQKVDFILGPIGVGLYWLHRRPGNRLGVLLIVLGLLGVVYVLESTTSPLAFTLGSMTEYFIAPVTIATILAFPTGRLNGPPERVIATAAFVAWPVFALLILLIAPHYSPKYSLSGCRAVCPTNPLFVPALVSWGPHVIDAARATVSAIYFGAAGLMIWRFVRGTPPRRRALAIGGPIALCFLLTLGSYQTLQLIDPTYSAPTAQPLGGAIDWIGAGTRSLIWYGFLFALIAAELFAGRVLRDVVRRSLGRPTFGELQGMLRAPLGDPALRVGLWDAKTASWSAADGGPLQPPAAGQTITEIERDGQPAAALVHDAQLAADPELVRAAGAVLVLAVENAELDASWQHTLSENEHLVDELRASRARIVQTAEDERVRLERDLHDGAQQRLMLVQVKLKMAEQEAPQGPLAEHLEDIRMNAGEAVEELRALAHGIYPSILRTQGLAAGLRSVAMSAPITVELKDAGIGRAPEGVEAAIYFCVREAIQNAVKHAGPGAHVTVTLARLGGELAFSVMDDGVGVDLDRGADGFGLAGMADRIEAVGGELEVSSAPGHGTSVHGRIPDPISVAPRRSRERR